MEISGFGKQTFGVKLGNEGQGYINLNQNKQQQSKKSEVKSCC
jgi:hypothetical protein